MTAGNYTVNVSDGNVTISASNTLTLKVGGVDIVIDSSGVKIQGKLFLPHAHSGVSTGISDTGPVA